MQVLQDAVLAGKDLRADEATEKHADWMEEILSRRSVTAENIETVIQEEIGMVFAKVLECAGVYKRTAEGKEAFLRFIRAVNGKGATK